MHSVLAISGSLRARLSREQAETLRTMSTVLIPDACISRPLSGRELDAAAIAASLELADIIRSALAALARAIAEYRRWRAALS